MAAGARPTGPSGRVGGSEGAGTDAAELVGNWDDLDRDERLEGLETAVNDMLDRYGYDPVDVVAGDVSGYGLYDDGVVYIDDVHTLESDSGARALETAFHEGAHAMEDQDDDLDLDRPEDYNEQDFDFSGTDANGEPRPLMADPDHQAVRDFAVAETNAAVGGGSSTGQPAAAAAGGGSEYGYGGLVIEMGTPLVWEFNFANAVVTGAGTP